MHAEGFLAALDLALFCGQGSAVRSRQTPTRWPRASIVRSAKSWPNAGNWTWTWPKPKSGRRSPTSVTIATSIKPSTVTNGGCDERRPRATDPGRVVRTKSQPWSRLHPRAAAAAGADRPASVGRAHARPTGRTRMASVAELGHRAGPQPASRTAALPPRGAVLQGAGRPFARTDAGGVHGPPLARQSNASPTNTAGNADCF